MPDARVANKYTFQDGGTEVSLMPGLDGKLVATLRIDGRKADDVKVTEHSTHWRVKGGAGVVHDERSSKARVRIPKVHLTADEPQPVTALLTIVTSLTNIAGTAGVTGPLETYQARLMEGEASEVHTLGGPGGEPVLGVHEYQDIRAICNHEPGSEPCPLLTVSGTIVFRTTGWRVDVRPTGGNTGPIPEHLTLDLVLTPPDGPSGDALTPEPFEFVMDPEGIEYQQVSFRIVGTDDEPPPHVEVQHVY